MNAEEQYLRTACHSDAAPAHPQPRTPTQANSSIARAALTHLPENGVVFIDSGAATLHVAQSLTESADTTPAGANGTAALAFVTHSIPVAVELSKISSDVQLLGGAVTYRAQSTFGDTTLRTLALMRAKVAVVDAEALNANHGLSTDDAQQAAVKSAMVTNADKVIVLCDSARFGREALVSFAPLDSIDVVITDADASDEAVRELAEHGIEVVRGAWSSD